MTTIIPSEITDHIAVVFQLNENQLIQFETQINNGVFSLSSHVDNTYRLTVRTRTTLESLGVSVVRLHIMPDWGDHRHIPVRFIEDYEKDHKIKNIFDMESPGFFGDARQYEYSHEITKKLNESKFAPIHERFTSYVYSCLDKPMEFGNVNFSKVFSVSYKDHKITREDVTLPGLFIDGDKYNQALQQIGISSSYFKYDQFKKRVLTDNGKNNCIWELELNGILISYLTVRKDIVFCLPITDQRKKIKCILDLLDYMFSNEEFLDIYNTEYDINQHNQNLFLRSCSNLRARVHIDAKNKIIDLQQDKKNTEMKYLSILDSIKKEEILVRGSAGDDEKLQSKIIKQIDLVRKIPQITNLKFDPSGTMTVSTSMIDCVNSSTGDVHEIGEFDIEFRLCEFRNDVHSEPNYIKWNNKTRLVDGYEDDMHAPHIFASGSACMGNSQFTFYELMKDFELAAAVGLAISFVENANLDDEAGAHLDSWPLKGEV